MRFPRVSIAGLMALSLIVALDCAGFALITTSIWIVHPDGGRTVDEELARRQDVLLATLLMANILAVVGVWGRRRPGRRGFLVAGTLAMVGIGVGVAITAPVDGLAHPTLLDTLIAPYLPAIQRSLGQLPELIQWPLGFAFDLLCVTGPTTLVQLGVALLGWWFDRRYMIRRRPRPESGLVGT